MITDHSEIRQEKSPIFKLSNALLNVAKKQSQWK